MKRHRLLIVGVGSIGERHVRCFLATGRADVAIAEPNSSLRGVVAEQYAIGAAWGSLEEALQERFDAAVVATPAPFHIPIALKLAGAGIHLLIEKPLALSRDGIEDLRQIVASKKIVAAVAYVHRAHPALAAMRRELVSGRFGRPVEIVATCGQNFPTYRPAYRQTYYANRSSGGGAVQDALTHVIDAGQWLVGPIDKLAADASHQLLGGVEVEDTVHVIARHVSVMGSYSLNQHQMPNELTISVHCERGTVRYEAHESRWRWMTEPGNVWHDERLDVSQRDALFIHQANAFLDAVEGKSAPVCPLEDGIAALNVNLAILSSMARRSWCDVEK